jgi:TolB-like protein
MSSEEGKDPGVGQPTVFLSYARADQAQATKIAQALEKAGLNVWWDALIEGGAAFAKTIEAALDSCDAVIVAWSKTSVVSDWVRDEAAKGRDLRKLVPVSLDRTQPPLGFGQYHAIDLSSWRGNADAAEIASVIHAVAAVGREAPLPPPRTQARRGPLLMTRRRVLAATAGTALAGVAGYVAWRQGLIGGHPKPTGNSVAVLPFENLSGDPNQAYFSDGLSEEVRSALARNVLLLVMGQTSSGKFRDSKDDAVTIAATLGVAFLLDGSVRRSGDIVRVAAELIDGRTGFRKWSQSFERKIADIFSVQSEIANTVARALALRVASGTTSAERVGGTENIDAYDAYLRGRALYDTSSSEAEDRAALAQFDAAIAADPNYAAAHAARSRSLAYIASNYASGEQLQALHQEAIAAARRAIVLGPDLADAHSTLGYTLFKTELDVRGASAPLDRSRVLGAGEATVQGRFAIYAAAVGRIAEAKAAIERARELDPLNPLVHSAEGYVRYAARDYASVAAPIMKALELNPKMGGTYCFIGNASLMLGQIADAAKAFAQEPNDMFRLPGIAIVEWKRGNKKLAQEAMDKLSATFGNGALYQQGQVLAQWGDKRASLAALEKAWEARDSGMTFLNFDPLLDMLRQEPRFSSLLVKMGFK